MIRKLTLILSLILLFATSIHADGLQAMKGKIANGYNFWLYEPPVYDGEKSDEAKPLVIFLHGRSLCGTDLDKVKRYGTISALEKGREINAYVVAPQNPGGSWQPSKIMDIVDYVCENNYIDETKIYVLGMSLGGYGTIDLMAAYPDRIAAGIGMCGGATAKDLSGLAKVPLWIIHGTGDNKVPVSKSDIVVEEVKNSQNGSINRMHYDRIPGMGHSEPARMFYVPDTYEWLFQHSLTDTNRPIAPTFKVTDAMKNAYGGLNNKKGSQSKSSKPALAEKKDSLKKNASNSNEKNVD